MAFDYAKAYQQFIDEELVAASATAWMIPEAGKVRFTGGRDVEISTLSTSGLGNYDATKSDGSAYPSGTVSNDWTTYTLAMDRGVKFALDRTSPNDTNFLATAENVIREFARNALVKEQDAYRIQKLYALANADTAHKGTHIVSAALTKSNIIEKVCGLLQTVRDDAEVMDGYVALVSHKNKSAFLAAATGTYHSITFGAGVSINGVTYDNVMLLDDLPCIFVPQSRMKTAVTVQTGRQQRRHRVRDRRTGHQCAARALLCAAGGEQAGLHQAVRPRGEPVLRRHRHPGALPLRPVRADEERRFPRRDR